MNNKKSNVMRLKLVAIMVVFGVLPSALLLLLLFCFVLHPFQSDSPNTGAGITAVILYCSVILALQTVAGFVIADTLTKPLMTLLGKLDAYFKPEESKAINKSAAGDPLIALNNSLQYFGEKKTDSERLNTRIREYMTAFSCSDSIAWRKEKGSADFTLVIPEIWRHNYPKLTLGTKAKLLELVEPGTADVVKSAFDYAEQANDRYLLRRVKLRINGDEYVTVSLNGRSVSEPDGSIAVVGVILDVTAKRQSDRAISERERMFRFTLATVEDIIYTVDIASGRFHIENPERWCDLFDVELVTDGFELERKKYWELIHPDFREGFLDRFFRYDHLMLLPDYSLSYEYRVRSKLGDWIWIEHTVSVTASDGDTPLRVIGRIANINKKKRKEFYSEFSTSVDALTGASLPSVIRRAFNDNVKEGLARFTVMVLDINSFALMNDTYGHETGDRLLRRMIELIWSNQLFRASVGRMHNDKFVIVQTEQSEDDVAERMAGVIVKKLEDPLTVGVTKLNVSVSIGIAYYDSDGQTFEEVLDSADIALLKAKTLGQNKYCFFSEKVRDEVIKASQS